LALALLDWIPRQNQLSLTQIQQVKGFFRWVTAGFPALRAYLEPIQVMENIATASRRHQRLSPEVLSSVDLIRTFLEKIPPGHKQLLHPGLLPSARPQATIRTDASGKEGKGWGCLDFFYKKLYHGLFTPQEFRESLRTETSSSTFLELLGVLKSLQRALPGLANKLILLEIDADNAVLILGKGWSRDPATNNVVTRIVSLLAMHNCVLRSRQIPRGYTMAADDLSKGERGPKLLDHLIEEVGPTLAKEFYASL
jgi:hypothetical protein